MLSGTGIMTRAIVSCILPGHFFSTCDRCCKDRRNCLLFDLILSRVDPIDGWFHRRVIPGFCPPRVAVRVFFILSLLNWHPFRPSSVFPLSLLRNSVLCPMPGGNPLLFKRLCPPSCHLRMSGCTVFRLDSFVMIRRIPRCGGVSAAFFKL